MKSLFFDLDGTLLDTSKRHYKLYLKECSMLGISPISIRNYWKLKMEKTNEKAILQKSNPEQNNIVEALSLRQKNIEQPSLLKNDTLFPRCVSVLQKLSKKYKLKIITSRSSSPNTKKQLHNLMILHFFSEVNSFGKKKLENFNNINSDRGIIIGDTELDYFIAKKIHFPFIFASYGIRSNKCMKKLIGVKPSCTIRNISDLTCDFIEKVFSQRIQY